MQEDTSVTAVAHVIQLAVAPVFLLSGIGAILAVMTNRLARIVDRGRAVKTELRSGTDALLVSELSTLSRRAKLIGRSITLCTATALLICAVIAVLFIGAFLGLDTSNVVALLFIAAMLAFFWGLTTFLREIFLATAYIHIGLEQLPLSTDPADGGGGRGAQP